MKILVLGGGSDQITLIQKLKERHAYIILVDYYTNPPAKKHADKHYIESTLDYNTVLNIALKEKVDIVTTACIDQALLTVSYVSEKLKLQTPFSYQTALNITNKTYMKQLFNKAKIPSSHFITVVRGKPLNLTGMSFPLVVKPADSNGSFGITKVMNENECLSALKIAMKISRCGKAIIEEFREGEEISLDAFVIKGEVCPIIATNLEKLNLAEYSFPIYQCRYPAIITPMAKKKLHYIASTIAKAFELDNTPLLIQAIVNKDEVSIIEFSARIAGGSKHHLIEEITNFDIMAEYINSLFDIAEKPVLKECGQFAAIHYVYAHPGIFQALIGVEDLINEGQISKYFIYKTPGMEINGYFASRDRVAAFISKADSRNELNKKILQSICNLKVLNSAGKDIMLRNF